MQKHPQAEIINELITLFINNRSAYYQNIVKYKNFMMIDCALQTAVAIMNFYAEEHQMSLPEFWIETMLGYQMALSGLNIDE